MLLQFRLGDDPAFHKHVVEFFEPDRCQAVLFEHFRVRNSIAEIIEEIFDSDTSFFLIGMDGAHSVSPRMGSAGVL